MAIGIHPAVHYLSGRGLTLGDILCSTGKAYGYGSKALRSVGTGMRKLLCDLSCTLVGICAQGVVLFKSVKSCRRTFLIDKADYLINKIRRKIIYQPLCRYKNRSEPPNPMRRQQIPE